MSSTGRMFHAWDVLVNDTSNINDSQHSWSRLPSMRRPPHITRTSQTSTPTYGVHGESSKTVCICQQETRACQQETTDPSSSGSGPEQPTPDCKAEPVKQHMGVCSSKASCSNASSYLPVWRNSVGTLKGSCYCSSVITASH